ncbi:serine/threonine-protein phosphatase 2A activator-like [Xenia sp. Carnegie-2017]|uniref:serine/threonine-protein phosphatase 2A activator-like n=1 Tax=Xenia sp. Carnegie-2017 TaxID=2897299 RepID=UPI001F03DC42|nr:serine/threonine-protein phosphatase 2A activator-like [Xenia sp. Carnegie-2017]
METTERKYFLPKREILSPMDIAKWLKSQAYHELLGFITTLNDAVKGKTMKCVYPKSENCMKIVHILDVLDTWINEIPPVNQPVRFGNTAYRSWFDRLEKESENILINLISNEEHLNALLELNAYFKDSFGNKTRIDYGTGHEVTFTAFLCCLFKLKFLQENDYIATVFTIFKRYLDLMRRLQHVYRMEPAGSHGVWGLDDFTFLPFYWGSAQLIDSNHNLRPDSIPNEDVCNASKEEFLFFDCVNNIHKVKSGPFFEHSNTLWGMSSVQTWNKVNSGLLKMYKVEVLSKFPVIQHFVFGSILSIQSVT